MKSKHILIGLVATAAGVVLISYLAGRSRERNMLKQVANEGYETAHDILFPGNKTNSNSKLRYGPVLPVDPDETRNV